MKVYSTTFPELYGRIGKAKPPAGDCCRLGVQAKLLPGGEVTVLCSCEAVCDHAHTVPECALYGLKLEKDWEVERC